ncbi:MAG: hypothetical protein IJW28_00805 [Clostridia bacterium]|nr:hypothetical protein [Clostridia bacterium]
MKNKMLSYIKYILIALGVGVILVPIFIVLISQVGFDKIYSHIFLTISVGLFITATILECVDIKVNNKNESIVPKVGIIIGFIIVGITFWF